jgi:PAS domain-containing protein
MVENAPEAIVVYDAVQKRLIEDVNSKAEQLFSCSREELLAGGPERFYADDAARRTHACARDASNATPRAGWPARTAHRSNAALVRAADGRNVTCAN